MAAARPAMPARINMFFITYTIQFLYQRRNIPFLELVGVAAGGEPAGINASVPVLNGSMQSRNASAQSWNASVPSRNAAIA